MKIVIISLRHRLLARLRLISPFINSLLCHCASNALQKSSTWQNKASKLKIGQVAGFEVILS